MIFHPPGSEAPGTYTTGRAAEVIARADPTFPATYVARQLRYMFASGGLRPMSRRGSGPNAAFVLQPVEVLHARILCAALQVGVSADVLTGADAWLANVRIPNEPGRVVLNGWPRVIADIREGREWFFVIEMDLDGSAAGYVTCEPETALQPLPGVARKGIVFLPLVSLLRPLLAEMEG